MGGVRKRQLRRLLDLGVAVVVLLVASTDGESSTAVGLVGTGVVLDVARAAKSSVHVQEGVATGNEEATSTLGNGGSGGTTN